jgi:DNA anti-recombination protein RmuC
MNSILPILLFFIGLAIGVTAAWLVLRAKGQNAYDRGKADAEGERIALTERVQARDQTIEGLNAKVQQLEAQVREGQATETSLKTKLAQYATTLDQERKQAEEKLAVVNQAQQKLADAFKALAAEALKSNNQSFLDLAKATLEKFQETAKGAKAPLSAYLDAIEAKDDETRTARLQAHARQVRDHICALGRKSYFEQFNPAPEFVVLFLPGEVFFSAALEHDPSLIEMGVEQNVIIATPTTLIALLRAVAYGWRQEKLAENAKEISDLGKELYKRLANMGDHLAKVGKSLAGATDAYNKAVASLETRVLVSARKFKDLGTTGSEDIGELGPVEVTPRLLQAPELGGGDGTT